jgi:outer membrane receptor protein involved in Fe transport
MLKRICTKTPLLAMFAFPIAACFEVHLYAHGLSAPKGAFVSSVLEGTCWLLAAFLSMSWALGKVNAGWISGMVPAKQRLSFLRHRGFRLAFVIPALVSLALPVAVAQNAVTGSLTGVVTDSTGAVVPGATVTVTDNATQATRRVTTNEAGRFSAPLLKPSTYSVSATTSGLQSSTTTITVLVGQVATADLRVSMTGTTQTVVVSADTGQLTDTQSPATVMTLTEQQVQELPTPGGDITTFAFTAPGVVLNSGGAYANFSSDGLPGTSNLYVLNGFDDEDPFLNLNNSGSSNLTLGQGEVSEAAIVQNGYSAQYGRAAGAIVDWTTKSGSNAFHGMANYYYNGSILNANDYFRKQSGLGRPKAVSNEWAANVGGPIIKNKLFFFSDYEGLHYVLPASGYVAFPTPAFQQAVLGMIPAANVPLYKQAFALYNASPNLKKAVPVVNGPGQLQDSTGTLGCGSAAALNIPDGSGGTFGTTSSCTSSAIGTASNINQEWLLTGRVDWNISDKNKLFGRYKMDRGTQPTYTNFVSPVFNVVSVQPEYEGQLNDTYAFSARATNQFIFASNWYTAFFGPANLNNTLAAFPVYFQSFTDGGSNGSVGSIFTANPGNLTLGLNNDYIDGRNVTQYQFVDDFAYILGNHSIKVGFNFRRDDISDYDSQQNFAGTYTLFMADFATGGMTSGLGSQFTQRLTNSKTAYLALYNLGVYAQDEWQASPKLKLTLGIRFDRTGNPLCNNNCFSLYNGAFPYSGVTTNTPYNKIVSDGEPHPFPNAQAINPQGRVGFNYDVTGNGRTVIRGGVGMFTDLYPAGFLDGFIQNLPNVYVATITSGTVGAATTAGSAAGNSLASFNAIESGFSHGATSTSLTTSVPAYAVPNFVISRATFKNPTYIEYSLQVQHQFTSRDAVILSYAGNVGYDEIIENYGVNASSPTGFAGFPAVSPDPNFLAVNDFTNAAHSNYNGASVTYKHIDSRGLSLDATYTYSKAMDDASNTGITNEPFNYNSYFGNSNYQIDPKNVGHLNYSLADYDIRDNFVFDIVYQMPFKFHHFYENEALGGWLIAAKSFYRAGQPFTVYNSAIGPAATGGSDGSGVLVDFLNPQMKRSCGAAAANPNTPCFTTSQFVPAAAQTDLGNLPRNQFTGPRYADSDISLSKNVISVERANVRIGATGANIFNHPNFALPAANIASGGLGSISSIAAPPTSPYGSFQGAGIGGRVLQVFGKVTF